MTSGPYTRRGRKCGKKQQHADHAAADAHLASLRQRGAWTRAMSAYRCRYCKAWHVGHKPRGKR